MDISFQQITYILRLAEFKNFGKAAAACFVTQPTLSMQLKKAEEVLGSSLFHRDRNPIELTAFGKNLLPFLYETQSDFDRLQELVDRSKGLFKEEIRIGIIPTVSAYLVPEIFEHQQNFHTGVKWLFREMKTEEILEQLERKKLDLGILAGPVDSDFLHSSPLYNEEILAYFPSQKKKNISVSILEKSQPWLMSQGNCLRTQMIHFCGLKEKQEAQDWNYEGGNLEMLLRMVDLYGGYTLVPDFYQHRFAIPKKSLKHIHGQHESLFPARNIIALTPQRNNKSMRTQELLQFIKLRYAKKDSKTFEVLNWS